MDPTRKPRAGEGLDPAALLPFLERAIPGLVGPLEVEQFPKGHSNLTYLLRAGDRELVLRRPPLGAKAIQSGHDMAREHTVLSHLHPVFPLAPRPLAFFPEASSPLGASFYVMERVPGVILRARPPEDVDLSPEVMRRVSMAFVDTLVALHAVDPNAAGLGELGKPEGYVRRQVDGWTQRYRKAQTDSLPQVEEVAGWLAAHCPA
jgi:aminoglycoside phosphotransferase (APT) family kinase protein